jgi:hypothetical protein
VAAVVGAPVEGFLEFVRHRPEQGWVASREQFEKYLSAVEAAARYVDNLQLGAGS